MDTTTAPPAHLVDLIERSAEQFITFTNSIANHCESMTSHSGIGQVEWTCEGDPDGKVYAFEAFTSGDHIWSGTADGCGEITFH